MCALCALCALERKKKGTFLRKVRVLCFACYRLAVGVDPTPRQRRLLRKDVVLCVVSCSIIKKVDLLFDETHDGVEICVIEMVMNVARSTTLTGQ